MKSKWMISALILFSSGQLLAQESRLLETSFTLYNYANMPKAVNVFQSRMRTFTGSIEIFSPVSLTCTHTEKTTQNSKPVINTVTQEGGALSFTPQRYWDHEILCSVSDKSSLNSQVTLQVFYRPEVLPDPKDDQRGMNHLNDWLDKVQRQEALLKLDMPPLLCKETPATPSYKVQTGFIYRMTQGGEACTSPINFFNGNILTFCSKNVPSGEFAMEVRSFLKGMKPLSKTIILDLETDTLRPKILTTKQNKELVVLHSLSGKVAAVEQTGKKVFELTLPLAGITEVAIQGENIYTVSQEAMNIDNYLYIVNASGKLIKETHLAGASFSMPFVTSDNVFVGNNKTQLHILSLQGELKETLELAEQLKYPGGAITHIFSDNEQVAYLATSKGEILKLDLNSLTVESLYLAPNDGKPVKMTANSRDREVLSTPVILKNGLIAFTTDSRVHFIRKDGSLERIIETGNQFLIQSPLAKFEFQGEELLWMGSMGHIYILNASGLKKMEYSPFDTHKSESMAENYSTPLVLPDGRILAGVYMGVRFFKLSTISNPIQLQNDVSKMCE